MAEPATTFSAAEAAVYDRQMRLWGVEAQQRLQRSHVLVAGLSALGSELAKNLALSGMAVTLQDASAVSAAAVGSQFFLDEADEGKNVAEACLPRVMELNPLVKVHSETRALEDLPDEFFRQFSVVCVVGAQKNTELRLDALCREAGIAFFATRTFGFEGIMFADLGDSHEYRRTRAADADKGPNPPVKVAFPPLAQSQAVTWSSLQSTRRRAPPLPKVFVKHQLLLEFKSEHGINGAFSKEQSEAFVEYAAKQLQANGLSADFFSTAELESLARVSNADLVPVCAVVAGIVGQEIIKAVSQKDEPICNYFFFDGTAGTVRTIG